MTTDKSQQRERLYQAWLLTVQNDPLWDRPHTAARGGFDAGYQAALLQPAVACRYPDCDCDAPPCDADQPAVAGAVDEQMIEEWETARFGAIDDDGSFVEFKNNGDAEKHPLGMQAQWFGGKHDHKVAVAVLRAIRTASPSQPESVGDERDKYTVAELDMLRKEYSWLANDNNLVWPVNWHGRLNEFGKVVLPMLLNQASLRASPADDGEKTVAARDVIAERQRQIDGEGWDAEHDAEHDRGELARAAACYAWAATSNDPLFVERVKDALIDPHGSDNGRPIKDMWPWGSAWWNPKDARRNLVRAGALILAEIERLDRAFRQQNKQS